MDFCVDFVFGFFVAILRGFLWDFCGFIFVGIFAGNFVKIFVGLFLLGFSYIFCGSFSFDVQFA